jgi:hypothetical protein
VRVAGFSGARSSPSGSIEVLQHDGQSLADTDADGRDSPAGAAVCQHGRKGLVEFDGADVRPVEAGRPQRPVGRLDRRLAEHLRFQRRRPASGDTGGRSNADRRSGLFRGDQHGRRAVVERGGVARGDGAIRAEGRLQRREGRQPRVVETRVSWPAGKARLGLGSTQGARLIDSTPAAIVICASPVSTSREHIMAGHVVRADAGQRAAVATERGAHGGVQESRRR